MLAFSDRPPGEPEQASRLTGRHGVPFSLTSEGIEQAFGWAASLIGVATGIACRVTGRGLQASLVASVRPAVFNS